MKTLYVFMALLAGILVVALRDWRAKADLEEVVFPTGVGDTRYYGGNLGNDDYREPNLRFPLIDGGLFRHNTQPVEKPDNLMEKLAKVDGQPLFIYVDTRKKPKKGAPQYYLKVGPGQYVEFRAESRAAAAERAKAE